MIDPQAAMFRGPDITIPSRLGRELRIAQRWAAVAAICRRCPPDQARELLDILGLLPVEEAHL